MAAHFQTLPIIQDGNNAKIPHPGDVISNQNPYPGDTCIHHKQIPVGCAMPPPPPPLRVDIDRCISISTDSISDIAHGVSHL